MHSREGSTIFEKFLQVKRVDADPSGPASDYSRRSACDGATRALCATPDSLRVDDRQSPQHAERRLVIQNRILHATRLPQSGQHSLQLDPHPYPPRIAVLYPHNERRPT